MLGLAHSHFTFTSLFGRNTLKVHLLDCDGVGGFMVPGVVSWSVVAPLVATLQRIIRLPAKISAR
jgi:hypothetical protein